MKSRRKENFSMWNNAFNYLMKIKRDYQNRFGSLDTYNVKEMCMKLNTAEYNNFLHCVTITNHEAINLFKYSLVLGGDIDIYNNPLSIYREMRGLAVDMEREQIVLCPFAKFFNIDEIEETSLNVVKSEIKRAKIFEVSNKLDGSMLSVRFYNNQFILGGTGSLHLNHNNPRLDESYDWLTSEYRKMISENPDKTFLFEYISSNDVHVVEYKEQGLYLIGIRDVSNGHTLFYRDVLDYAKRYNVKTTALEKSSLDKLLLEQKTHKANEKEGWVLRIDDKMYKMKCDDYVKIHSMLSEKSSPKTLIYNIRNGTLDDLLANVPASYRNMSDKIIENIYQYIKIKTRLFDSYWKKVKDISDKKEFAKAVNKQVPKEFQGLMFSKKKGEDFSFLQSRNGKYIKYYQIIDFLQVQTKKEGGDMA